MVQTFNTLIGNAFALLLGPLNALGRTGALLSVAALTGLVLALMFRVASPQSRLRQIRCQLRAELLTLRLFGNNLRVLLAAYGRLVVLLGRRLVLSTPALLLGLPVFLVVMVQMAVYFEHRPLLPGETAVAAIQLTSMDQRRIDEIAVSTTGSVMLDAPLLCDANRATIWCRLKAVIPGAGALSGAGALPAGGLWVVTPESRTSKTLNVRSADSGLLGLSTRRPGSDWWDQILHPAEPPCPSGSVVKAITIDYPPGNPPFRGLPWWVIFVGAAMVSALLTGRFLRIDF